MTRSWDIEKFVEEGEKGLLEGDRDLSLKIIEPQFSINKSSLQLGKILE